MFPLWEVFRDVLDESTATDEFVLLHVAVAVYVPPPPKFRQLSFDGVPVASYLRPQRLENLRGAQPPVTIHVHRGEPSVGVLPRRRHGENPVERRAADGALRVMDAKFVGARQVKEVRARPRPLLPHPASVLLGQHGRVLRTQRVEAHRALAVRLGDVRVPRRPRRRRSRTRVLVDQMLTLERAARGGDERGGIRASHHRRHGPGVGRRPEPDVETETHPLRLLLRPRLGVCSPGRPRLEPSPRHRAAHCVPFSDVRWPGQSFARRENICALRAARCDDKHRHVSAPLICVRNRVIRCEKSDAALPARAEFRVNLATRGQ